MRAWTLGALVFATLIAVAAWHTLYWGEDLQAADFAYPAKPGKVACAKGDPSEMTRELPRLRVVAPRNYRADHAHGLLVVFSPAGFGPALTERFMGLTNMATRKGLIVAYVASRPMSEALAARLARVPNAVARNWCIDASRIAFVGHSNGGTLAQVVALQPKTNGALRPRAIVASGAGLLESDFGALDCPASGGLDVLILHGRNDSHFPDCGSSATRGWARCLGCAADPVTDASDCQHHAGCRGHLTFCQHEGRHWTWPDAFRQASVDSAH
jgi:polyhydroxybutyrate depolymerase